MCELITLFIEPLGNAMLHIGLQRGRKEGLCQHIDASQDMEWSLLDQAGTSLPMSGISTPLWSSQGSARRGGHEEATSVG